MSKREGAPGTVISLTLPSRVSIPSTLYTVPRLMFGISFLTRSHTVTAVGWSQEESTAASIADFCRVLRFCASSACIVPP